VAVWRGLGAGAAGIVIDTLRGEAGQLSLVIYLTMGWLIVFALDPSLLPCPDGLPTAVAGASSTPSRDLLCAG